MQKVGTTKHTQLHRARLGFTIVELLIVIVVIAILAVITLVSFNGISKRAQQSSVQSSLSQANKKVLLYYAEKGVYPDTLSDADFIDKTGAWYDYSSDNTVTPRWYQLTVSNGVMGAVKYSISSSNATIQEGAAVGSNLVSWDKADNTSAPILATAGVTFDTSVYRTSTSSIRISPGYPGRSIRVYPSGSIGQVVRVSFWMKTDPTWNGTAANSKVRFATYPAAAYLSQCPYDGVKTTWTYITCSYTLNAANTQVVVQMGNDGTVGNAWFDDFYVSVQ